VKENTSEKWSGMIAMMDPKISWVARWKRDLLNRIPGIYADLIKDEYTDNEDGDLDGDLEVDDGFMVDDDDPDDDANQAGVQHDLPDDLVHDNESNYGHFADGQEDVNSVVGSDLGTFQASSSQQRPRAGRPVAQRRTSGRKTTDGTASKAQHSQR